MKFLLLLGLIVTISLITAQPVDRDGTKTRGIDVDRPEVLLDLADVGDSHSNTADRYARHGWGGGGWGGNGWGGGGYGGGGWGGGGYGGGGWGGHHGGWGGHHGGWGGGGWG